MSKNLKLIPIWTIIVAMTTFFKFASNGPMNHILIAIMYSTPFLLILQYPYIKRSEFPIFLLLIFMVIAAALNLKSLRFSTLFYSLMFIATFLYYWRNVKTLPLSKESYLKIVKFLFYTFFIVLIFQQISDLLNVPIFNYRVPISEIIKYNSLASEPSYYGKIIVLLMLSFLTIREIEINRQYSINKDIKNDKIIWIIFFYQIIVSGSSFAILLLAILLFRYVNKKYFLSVLLIIIFSVFIIIVLSKESIVIQRILKMSQSVFSFNEEEIFKADTSGAFRIVPTIRYIKEFDFFNLKTWFGFGIDFTRNHLLYLHPAVNPETGFYVGLFPAFIWDFGVISTIILMFIVFKYAIYNLSDFVIWFVISLDAPFNTQLFWITLMLMATNKYLKRKHLLSK
jgi:hypothetical protein